MANIRLLPPKSGLAATFTNNGRTYSCAANSYADIPDFDAQVAAANGWDIIGYVGTTAQRPTTNRFNSQPYVDTTLGYTVFFDGVVWRNPSTGASV